MLITEAIILAGGEGTRLKAAVPQLPKCLAPVNGRAFIDYIILHLQSQGIKRFTFALGVKAEAVQAYLNQHWPKLDKAFSLEKTPLGTGGAIKNAASLTTSKHVLVVNGDTLFKLDLAAAASFHFAKKAECTILLKPLQAFDRYGAVKMNENGSITRFHEKKPAAEGLINAGCYLLNIYDWLSRTWPVAFSFEENYLQAQIENTSLYGIVQDSYFIDIGVPQDYQKAQNEISV